MSSALQSLQYSRGSLKVLDQLLLPHETAFVDVNNVQDAWAVIRSMQVRGAPLIAITAALGLAVEADKRRKEFTDKNVAAEFLLKSMEYLRTSRPTAVNLFVAMDELTNLVKVEVEKEGQTADGLIETTVLAAEKIFEDDIKTNRSIGHHGAKKILEITGRERIRVLTICNTGSLATADYGTALGVVRALHDLGKLEHVYACETRPYNQGARLTAYEIVSDKLPGTLITDSMASALMAVKGVDVVVVGADRIAANGDTANKIGTYQLAIAAKYHHIPFFTAAPTTTLDLSMSSGAEIHVEERPGVELTSIFGQKIAPDGINVWNPAFDVTPCALIRGIITELGVIEPEFADPKGMSRNSDTIIPVANFIQSKLAEIANASTASALAERLKVSPQPISVPIGFDRLDESKIGKYIFQQKKLTDILKLTEEDIKTQNVSILKISEVGDGNLNFVYIIEGREGNKIVVKQALPFVRCVGEGWPLTLKRAYFECQALEEERKLTNGEYVPEVYHFDHAKCIIAMRYIQPPHLILRKFLIKGEKITTFAKDLGIFLAKTLFGTSGLALSGGDLRLKVAEWSQNVAMCALTEKVIFSDPYTDSPLNRWTKPHLDTYVQGIRNDQVLKLAASYHKQVFLTHTQALVHGDLHTGSVMAHEGSTFVIDPEFAFYGPMGFDLGAIISNLYLAYFAHSVKESGDYAEWILKQIEILHENFVNNFVELWQANAQAKKGLGEYYVDGIYSEEELKTAQVNFLNALWRDTLGFTGSKMIRRIVGIAHVEDLESIEDFDKRSVAEKRALLFARTLVLASYQGNTNEDGLNSIVSINAKFARPLFQSTPSEAWPTTN